MNISRLPVCQDCLALMQPFDGNLCSICGERVLSPHAASVQEAVCGLCRRARPPYMKAGAYGSYDGALRGLIHLLKYEQVHPAVVVLGRMLADAMGSLGALGPRVVVVPVPLHANKRRQRGFNQSEQIARAALKFYAVDERMLLNTRVLERQRATQSQIGLTRHQRRENMRGAFRVVHPEEARSREILLVDDVFTTGTTVSECARVLRRAGASNIWVATVARTMKENTQQVEISHPMAA